jgi:DNA-directed RNA polymerase specialized sigma24 family protein
MDPEDDCPAPLDPARFGATRWTVVLEAAQSCAVGGPEALAWLCARYWRPLYAFARGRGQYPEDAQDLVQGFFAHLIEHRTLRSGGRAKGRFRSFLLASFQNFMANERRRAYAEKRGGRAEVLRLDWKDEEGRLAFEPKTPSPRRPCTTHVGRCWSCGAPPVGSSKNRLPQAMVILF